MKATEINRRGVHTPYPIITFNIEIENEEVENDIVITNIVSTVRTASPMKRLYLGRLEPCEAFMSIAEANSSLFNFDLNLGWKALYDIEDARQNQRDSEETKDLWLEIRMKIAYMEVLDWTPIRFRWEEFRVDKEIDVNKIRISQSDWLNLRTKLGYGKMRIIEVTEETYELIEKYMEKIKTRSLEEATHTSILNSLAQESDHT